MFLTNSDAGRVAGTVRRSESAVRNDQRLWEDPAFDVQPMVLVVAASNTTVVSGFASVYPAEWYLYDADLDSYAIQDDVYLLTDGVVPEVGGKLLARCVGENPADGIPIFVAAGSAGSGTTIRIREQDGTPNKLCDELRFPNGTLDDPGGTRMDVRLADFTHGGLIDASGTDQWLGNNRKGISDFFTPIIEFNPTDGSFADPNGYITSIGDTTNVSATNGVAIHANGFGGGSAGFLEVVFDATYGGMVARLRDNFTGPAFAVWNGASYDYGQGTTITVAGTNYNFAGGILISVT